MWKRILGPMEKVSGSLIIPAGGEGIQGRYPWSDLVPRVWGCGMRMSRKIVYSPSTLT